MPFKQSNQLTSPSDPNNKIWRYMDFTKFLSLLDRSALYFIRADQLSNMDPFEGFFTNANAQLGNFDSEAIQGAWNKFVMDKNAEKYERIQNNQMTREIAEQWYKNEIFNNEKSFRELVDNDKLLREGLKSLRYKSYINSWHLQEHESAAMWNFYAKDFEGIAIESTYRQLCTSFDICHEFDINIGIVKYLDYKTEYIPNTGKALLPFFHKRKSYEHERELRAICIDMNKNEIGVYIPVKLDELITRVFVSPTAPSWIHKLLESVLKKFGLEKEVCQSDLSSTPIY